LTLNRAFFLLTLAFFAMCGVITSATVAASIPESRSSALLFTLAFAAIAGVVLWFEGRRDLDAVLTLVATVLGLTAMCVTIYLFAADHTGIAPKVSAALTGIGAATCAIATYRRQRTASFDFPNVLASEFQPSQIYETEGIQFTGLLTPGPGQHHHVSVVLQNCFDAPRRVTICFDAGTHAKYLRFEPAHVVDLGPAEVARRVVPVVTPTYAGTYHLYFSVGVTGSTGRRVRLWRAQEATHRTTAGEMAALALVGVIKWGGGVRFTVGPLPDDLWTLPLPAAVTESVWRPVPGRLPFEPRLPDAS
jgi:hypothetical protein